MKNRFFLGLILLILLTTFISQKKISVNNLKVKHIEIQNNKVIKNQELIKDLSFLYNKNMIFLNSYEINKQLGKKSFIKRLEIRKIYPDKLVIKIIEKEPIAILANKTGKFFLGKNFELIRFRYIERYKNLPVIYGDNKNFKLLFYELKKINFPIQLINKYQFFETNRWDIIMNNKKIIKLPSKNYKDSLKNFLEIRLNSNFEKYKIFDYRLNDQLILK